MKNKILNPICPNCGYEMYWNLDMYDRIPWHLHCDNCKINIGTDRKENALTLLKLYNKIHTDIEYYANNIQFLFKDGDK